MGQSLATAAPVRFHDDLSIDQDFMDEILAVCPNCRSRALVTRAEPFCFRLVCSHCGALRRYSGQAHPEIVLWLRAAVGREVLWAYNLHHLEWIEAFVRAPLRERRPGELGWRNKSVVSRLPVWIKSHKRRESVLRAIARLKQAAS